MVEELTQPSRPTANRSQAPVQPTRQVEGEQSIMGIPRETFEEMMGACSKILIRGLRKEGSRGDGRKDDVELGEMPRMMNVETRPEDVTLPEESREGFWDGGYVEVFSEEEIKAEDDRRALELESEARRWRDVQVSEEVIKDSWAGYWIGNDETYP